MAYVTISLTRLSGLFPFEAPILLGLTVQPGTQSPFLEALLNLQFLIYPCEKNQKTKKLTSKPKQNFQTK